MIFEQLDRDVGVRQQLHVVMKLARRDGTRTFPFDPGVAGGAQAQIKIGSRKRELVAGSLKQVVRQDGDGGLAFDHTLSRRELPQEFKFADRNFHGGGPRR